MNLPVLDIKDSFLARFRHLIVDHNLDKKGSRLNLFMLPIRNGDFDYNDITKELSNNMVKYCLSKNRRNMYLMDERYTEMVNDAADKFRNSNSNDGELGELLLYCLLESHLKAPKLISKMLLKTSNNDYIKRADGIHILKIDKNNYQLIFGESKMHSDISRAIKEAFKSVSELITRGTNNIESELLLIDSHLQNELDDVQYQFIKKIIFPKEVEDDVYEYDNSFGILLGFQIEIPIEEVELGNSHVRNWIEKEVKNMVESNIEKIKEKIKENNLLAYNCYIYVMPFTKIKDTRRGIIEKISGR